MSSWIIFQFKRSLLCECISCSLVLFAIQVPVSALSVLRESIPQMQVPLVAFFAMLEHFLSLQIQLVARIASQAAIQSKDPAVAVFASQETTHLLQDLEAAISVHLEPTLVGSHQCSI